jgi:hypothetical protein
LNHAVRQERKFLFIIPGKKAVRRKNSEIFEEQKINRQKSFLQQTIINLALFERYEVFL